MPFTVAELTFCETAQVYKTRTNISIANTSKKETENLSCLHISGQPPRNDTLSPVRR